jgi:hypothetical protein
MLVAEVVVVLMLVAWAVVVALAMAHLEMLFQQLLLYQIQALAVALVVMPPHMAQQVRVGRAW